MPEKMKLGDGQEVSAQEVKFDTIEEPWCIYRLEDGTQVRLKTTVLKMFRVLDDDGNPAYTPEGDPFIIVRSSRQVTASKPQEEAN